MSKSNKKRCLDDAEPSSSDEVTLFTIKKRKDDFSERTWWMLDMEGCESNQGATGLVKRCMREYDWSLDKAKKILKAYCQFLTLKKELRDWNAEILSPSHLVYQMWHQHILDISNYYHDMVMMCGQIVLHHPDGALDWKAKRSRDERTRAELIKKFGSVNVDKEVWGFPPIVTPLPRLPRSNSSSVEAGGRIVTIRIMDPAGQVDTYEISMNTKMGELFQLYAQDIGMCRDKIRFLFDGFLIEDHVTPKMLELEDFDRIDLLLDQLGC